MAIYESRNQNIQFPVPDSYNHHSSLKGTDFPVTTFFFLGLSRSETFKKRGFSIMGPLLTKLIVPFFPVFKIKTGFADFLLFDYGFRFFQVFL
jgi:hypothetical protein